MKKNGLLNIITALPCEARLFLDEYRLVKLENPSSYSIFANAERSIHLIVSGIGKVKSAAALSYLHALSGAGPHTTYLNVGIAGAAGIAIGELFLAHKIIDSTSHKTFYPLPILIDCIPSIAVVTVDQPTAHYPNSALVDMEAVGFHQAALSFVTQEQIQTLKIVSDNSEQSMQTIRAEQVIQLFQKNKSLIHKIVENLLEFSSAEFHQQTHLDHFSDFMQHFHFTNYQQHQLRELLRRWQINFPQLNPLTVCSTENNATLALFSLKTHLENSYFAGKDRVQASS